MPEEGKLVVPVRVSPAMFHEFGMFDAFSRQKRWRGPLSLPLLLCPAIVIAFRRAGELRGALLLGIVLTVVALGLPAAYIFSFMQSLKKQERVLAGAGDMIVYTLHLGEGGFTVLQGEQSVDYTWDQVLSACRLERCMCLYIEPQRAYLLPGETGSREEQAVWELISRHVPAEKQTIRRAKGNE